MDLKIPICPILAHLFLVVSIFQGFFKETMKINRLQSLIDLVAYFLGLCPKYKLICDKSAISNKFESSQ